jgi:integrase
MSSLMAGFFLCSESAVAWKQAAVESAGLGARDTFAVELLLAGVPLDRVSVLLEHQSIRVTERHYAPWTASRQEQLERDLRASWTDDPVALSQTKGTPEVHGGMERIN